MAGLVFATACYHLLPQSGWTQLCLVGGFTFALRYIGPANYGVFTIAISGLIVFLLAAAGVSPAQVILARGLNTMAGGVLALAAYAVWPTWERTTIADSLSEMLEATRAYFRSVADLFTASIEKEDPVVSERRTDWRRARSAAEAAVDRVSSEPGAKAARLSCLNSIMASSHALVNAIMGIEAGLIASQGDTAPEAFRTFANDVEFTLYFLAQALHGAPFANRTLPELRRDHRRLVEAREGFSELDQYILAETDRLTVSLNTLREQVIRYLHGC